MGGEPRALTLVAVRQEVGAGLQVLPVEAVYGDGWVLGHLSLEATHSTRQARLNRPGLSLRKLTPSRASPPLPGTCRRRAIGQPGAATSNQRSRAVAGAVPKSLGAGAAARDPGS